MTRKPHTHAAATSTDRPFFGPVVAGSANQNPAAHGNITRTETCSCGCTRLVNINGSHRELSTWS
jgi:hypothetical protein